MSTEIEQAAREMVKRLLVITAKEVRTLMMNITREGWGRRTEFLVEKWIIMTIMKRRTVLTPGKVARMIRRHFSRSDCFVPFPTREEV